jgi:uncharacterized membrane protein
MKKAIYYAILAISITALAVSTFTETQQHKPIFNQVCGAIYAGSACEEVQNSVYGKIFGIDTALYGVIGFSLLTITTLWFIIRKDRLSETIMIIGTLIGGIAALRFLYMQAFILHKICVYCVIVDTLAVALLAIGLHLGYLRIKKRKDFLKGQKL